MALYSGIVLLVLVFFIVLACVEQLLYRKKSPQEVLRVTNQLALATTGLALTLYVNERTAALRHGFSHSKGATIFGVAFATALFGFVIYCICGCACRESFLRHGHVFLPEPLARHRGCLLKTALGAAAVCGFYGASVFYFGGVVARLGTLERITAETVLLAAAAGFVEEIFFRAWVQNRIGRWSGTLWPRHGALIAILATSTIFAAAHFQGPLKFIQVFPIGIVFGYVYQRWGLAASILAHVGSNCVHYLLIVAIVHVVTS